MRGKVASMWRNKGRWQKLSGQHHLVCDLPKNGFGLRIGVKVRGIILRSFHRRALHEADANRGSPRTATPGRKLAITCSRSLPIYPCSCCITRSWPILKSSRDGPTQGWRWPRHAFPSAEGGREIARHRLSLLRARVVQPGARDHLVCLCFPIHVPLGLNLRHKKIPLYDWWITCSAIASLNSRYFNSAKSFWTCNACCAKRRPVSTLIIGSHTFPQEDSISRMLGPRP